MPESRTRGAWKRSLARRTALVVSTEVESRGWVMFDSPLPPDTWQHSGCAASLYLLESGRPTTLWAAWIQILWMTYLYAAAKSLQSCPTLCDPRDGSLPGSSAPGILQARTPEWVAISFSNAWEWKSKVKLLSHVRLRNPMDCSPPGSSIHRIFQARILEWGAIAFSDIIVQTHESYVYILSLYIYIHMHICL